MKHEDFSDEVINEADGPSNLTRSKNHIRSGNRKQVAGALAREQLLNAANELFYREGVRSVGIDAVVDRAGLHKMSLYRQFSSKDDLVFAYVAAADQRCISHFQNSVAAHPGHPADQLKQCFDDLLARASAPDFRGCPLVNVAVEFATTAHPARRLVAEHKARLIALLAERAEDAGADDAAGLANALGLLIEGVYAASQTMGPGCGPVKSAPRIAAMLIDDACGRNRR